MSEAVTTTATTPSFWDNLTKSLSQGFQGALDLGASILTASAVQWAHKTLNPSDYASDAAYQLALTQQAALLAEEERKKRMEKYMLWGAGGVIVLGTLFVVTRK